MPAAFPISLAQIGKFINPDVPALPDPPLLQRIILEQPTLPAIAALLIGIVALFALRNAGRTKAGPIALCAGILLCIGLITAGRLVRTDRETLLLAQDSLVTAVAGADLETLENGLDPSARIRGLNVPGIRPGQDRDGIISLVRSTTGGAYTINNFRIIKRQAIIDGPNSARTQIYVRVEPTLTGTPTFAWFRILWRLDPDDSWRAVEIEPLFISGVLAYQG